MFFSAIVNLEKVYARFSKVGAKGSPAPLCALRPFLVPSDQPVLISDVTHRHESLKGVNVVKGKELCGVVL